MKKILALIVSALTAVSVVFGVTTANAYPTGSALRVNVSANQVNPGTQIFVSASNAYPGCTVTFTSTVNRKVEQTLTAVAGGSGRTSDVVFTLSSLGTYTIGATYSCNRNKESASATVKSGRLTATTIDSASSVGKVFSASGFIKWGSFAAPNMPGTVVFKDPAGGTVGSVKVTSSATGSYTASLTTRKLLGPGTYSVTVTFTDLSPYIGSSAGPRSIVKSASVVLGKASYKTNIK